MRVLARGSVVGKRSEDPRSCWTEMTGAGKHGGTFATDGRAAGSRGGEAPTPTYVGLRGLARTRARATLRK